MINQRRVIAVTLSLLLYAETYVASMGHWWPDFRQVLFVSAALLTISLTSISFAESYQVPVLQRLTLLAALFGSAAGLISRSMGPDLFAANWLMICCSISASIFLLRSRRLPLVFTLREHVKIETNDPHWKTRLPHLLFLYICVSITSRIVPRSDEGPATIHWIAATSLTACIFAEIMSYARIKPTHFFGMLMTVIAGTWSFWLLGERMTRAYHAGSSPEEYARNYAYSYSLFATALLIALLFSRPRAAMAETATA